jgi:GWxTD domain-containing protein
MNLKIITLLILFVISAQAQLQNTTRSIQPQPNYFQDFINFASDTEGLTRTDIFIQVPYNEVQFILSGNKFVSNYTISISVFTENKEKLIVEKTWNEKLEATDFQQTTSKNNFNLSMRSFNLEPGRYFIRTSVDDRESSRNFVSENIFTARNLSADNAISDILILAKKVDDEGPNTKILPNISKNISVGSEGIPVFYELYSKRPRIVTIEYSILDEKKKVVSQVFENEEINPGTNTMFYTYKDTALSLGTYTMYISAKGTEGENFGTVNKSFTSRWSGIPSVIQDLDKAVQQMVYIATEDELSHIKQADTRDEKVKRYLEFWKKKDPVPESEENEIFNEYYRRIEYANKNFSHYSEGWKTDRGMVFVILGSPNNVDRHPFETNTKPYEVWEYYTLNRSFVFVDETGFGDYRLITPLYGDNYRFR